MDYLVRFKRYLTSWEYTVKTDRYSLFFSIGMLTGAGACRPEFCQNQGFSSKIFKKLYHSHFNTSFHTMKQIKVKGKWINLYLSWDLKVARVARKKPWESQFVLVLLRSRQIQACKLKSRSWELRGSVWSPNPQPNRWDLVNVLLEKPITSSKILDVVSSFRNS